MEVLPTVRTSIQHELWKTIDYRGLRTRHDQTYCHYRIFQFGNRGFSDVSPPMNSFLPIANDEQWRRIRSTFSPAFSVAKLKEVIPLIEEATDFLAKKLLAAANTGEISLLTFVKSPWFLDSSVTKSLMS